MTGDHFMATLCRLDVFLLFTFLNIISNSREKEKLDEGSLKDYNKFGYGLSVTAGISFKHFILQCTYQRELNKTIKKKKEYEQNILLSLGYEF